jgi:hypothetical protein
MTEEVYKEVQPTDAMTEIIVEIMAEVLSILGIVTKEIGQGRMSTSFPVDNSSEVDLRPEKYLKKLVGWPVTPVEDAVQRLDRLTQEEYRMAAAETLTTIHRADSRMKGVQGNLKGVDQRIQTVDLKVQGIDDKVQEVKKELQGVGDKVGLIIEGKVYLLSPSYLDFYSGRWKGDNTGDATGDE